jgi:hypothetical protein
MRDCAPLFLVFAGIFFLTGAILQIWRNIARENRNKLVTNQRRRVVSQGSGFKVDRQGGNSGLSIFQDIRIMSVAD